MELLCPLVIALAVITLVGHGIWVFVAFLVRQLTDDQTPATTTAGPPRCPKCSAFTRGVDHRCRSCGFDLAPAQRGRRARLAASVQSQLTELAQTNAITADELAQLKDVLHTAQERWNQPVEYPAIQAVEVPTPVAPRSKPVVPLPVTPQPVQSTDPAADVPDNAAVQVAPETPLRPRRALADLLQAFMEERNIRWGELVSGMLIVISAVGLVISLWSTLSETIPYFPALLFMLMTAAIHGAGLYTLRQWRLLMTSQGLLVISMLLVPLNFLAAIALSEADGAQRPFGDPWYVTAVAVGLLSYGAITFSAARTLLGRWWRPMFVAVMGASSAQLVLARTVAHDMTTWSYNGLALLPLAPFLTGMLGYLHTTRNSFRLTRRRATHAFQLLSFAIFSLILALALLVWKSGAVTPTLAAISPCLNVSMLCALALGLVVQQRASGRRLSQERTTGAAIVLLMAMLTLATLVLAWPRPDLLLAIGLIDFLLLTALAFSTGAGVLHVGALAALGMLTALATNLASGTLSWATSPTSAELWEALGRGRSGLALLLLAGAAQCASSFLARASLRDHAQAYRWTSGGLTAAALLIACYSGFWSGLDGDLATIVLSASALSALVLTPRIRRAEFTWLGTGLTFLAFWHALLKNVALRDWLESAGIAPQDPAVVAALLHAMTTTASAVWFARHTASPASDEDAARTRQAIIGPLTLAAVITSALTWPRVFILDGARLAIHAAYAGAIALVWGVAAVLRRSRALLTLSQSGGATALALGIAAFCRTQAWWTNAWLDPRHLQFQLGGLAVWSLAWSAVRRRPVAALQELIRPGASGIAFDRVMLALCAYGGVGLAYWGALPGIVSELGRTPAVPGALLISKESDLLMFAICAFVAVTAMFCLWQAFQHAVCGAAFCGLITTLVLFGFLLTPGFNLVSPEAARFAHGVGGWWVLALVLAGLLLELRQRVTPPVVAGLLVTLFAPPLLISGSLARLGIAAPALSWSLAGYAVVVASLVVVGRSIPAIRRLVSADDTGDSELPGVVRGLGSTIATLPILIVLTAFVTAAFSGTPIAGPPAGTWFDRIGPLATHVAPLGIIGASFIVYALRDRIPQFALGASLIVHLLTALVVALPIWLAGRPLQDRDDARYVVWTALALALYSAGWMLVRQFRRPFANADAPPPAAVATAFDLHPVWSLLWAAIPLAWTAIAVIVRPGNPPTALGQFGAPAAYFGVLLLTACAWRHWSLRRSPISVAFAASLAGVLLITATTVRRDDPGDWLTFHTMASGICLLVVAAATTVLHLGRTRQIESAERRAALIREATGWALALAALTACLAMHALIGNPLRPWSSAGWMAAVSLCAAAMALQKRSQPYAYASVLAGMLATAFVWLRPWLGLGAPASPQSVVELIEAILLTSTLCGCGWLTVELWWQRRGSTWDARNIVPPVHLAAAGLGVMQFGALAVYGLGTRTGLAAAGNQALIDVSNPGGWSLIAGLAALLAGSLWDRRARHVGPTCYLLGLVLIVLILDELAPSPRRLLFDIGVAASAYCLLTSLLAATRRRWDLQQTSGNASPSSVAACPGWLLAANLSLAAVTTLIELYVVWRFPEANLRWTGTAAAGALVAASAALAVSTRRHGLRMLTFLLATVTVVDAGWALMPAYTAPIDLLDRAIRLLVMLAASAFVLGVCLVRVFPAGGDWFRAVRTVSATIVCAALAALLAVLALERTWYDRQLGAPVTALQTAVVALVLVGLAAALVSMAVLPGRDPLGLQERGRRFYVYAAEAVLALLFLHIRLTIPELFHGYLLPYWPFIVIAIAFAGIGIGELFDRLQLTVLSAPLRRTGVFLPLLPALGYWVHLSLLGRSSITGDYSLVMFVIGLLYVTASMWRPSFLYGVLAALAGNAALWALLNEHGIQMLAHPQMWLIPPALSVLGAAQLNRRRLTEPQMTAIRYLSVIVIYVSSTGEMFLQGIGENLWLPVVLASLSVCGVFAGILLQVRAFLYLGTSFLMLSLVSMVWHAARNIGHVWPWWAFGIVLGLAILTLFGLFERKRNEFVGALHSLQRWDP